MGSNLNGGSREIICKVQYSSTVSNILILILLLIFIPLIVAPLLIIRLDLITITLMVVLLVALGYGLYIFRVANNKKVGSLVISPGYARLEEAGVSKLAIGSKGLTQVDSITLKYSSFVFFETRIYFESEDDCEKAKDLIKSYY